MLSRRRFLAGAATLVVLVGAASWLRRSWRQPTARRLSSTERVTPALARVVVFLGALFGRELSEADQRDLSDRLAFAVAAEPRLAEDYEVLAAHLDRFGRKAGATEFLTASDAQRETVIDHVMRIGPPSLVERAWSHLVRSRKLYYQMRFETIPQLQWLYRHSGVPWRARGYTRWQGIPGDWREYTRAGPPYP
ncbi:MAG TPA: twin-arginine translocation signal domain-containing protein [Steroidobacteraceae bacterium]|nr:twin-arginine translocation signal domain-containing protein [Steroidobacteraceae bacterium]